MIKPSHWSCVHQLRDSEKSAISTYINYQSPILNFCCNRSLLLLVVIPLFISYPCRGVLDTATALRSWSLPMLATCNICWKRGLVARDMFHPWNIRVYRGFSESLFAFYFFETNKSRDVVGVGWGWPMSHLQVTQLFGISYPTYTWEWCSKCPNQEIYQPLV